eukprot:5524080-Pyramimonas_sp.AAC.1
MSNALRMKRCVEDETRCRGQNEVSKTKQRVALSCTHLAVNGGELQCGEVAGALHAGGDGVGAAVQQQLRAPDWAGWQYPVS